MRTSKIAALMAASFLSFNAQAVDLLQIYREALVNDPVFASAKATLAAGQEKLPQGRAGLLPTIGLGGSYNRTSQNISAMGTESNSDYSANAYSVSLTQPLFRLANWEQYQQGILVVAASEALFAQASQDLIVRVSQAYFDVLAAHDALATVQAQKIAITEQLASARRNFEVGTATITDTHEAQARFDLVVAQEFAGQNDLAIRQAALQQIIGKPAGALATLRAGVQLSAPLPLRIEKWVEVAETQNFGVIGQQLAVEIAQREIKKNRAAHAPTLDLVASRNHINQTGSVTSPIGSVVNANVIGVQWTIPLFAGFAIDSKVKEAIALEDKARNDLENARRTAAQGARQAFLSVNNGLAQVKALEAAEVSSQSALDSNKLGYQVGVRINIDVLNAQQQLYSTRRDLAKARYDTILNGLRLESAAGNLNEDDLLKVNALLTDRPIATAVTGNPPAENKLPAARPPEPAKPGGR
jgi:outer membrane protein